MKSDPISLQGKYWVYWADFDWVGARVLYLKKNPKLWMPVGLLAHKALEQYMKAFLRSWGDKTEWSGIKGHNLCRLARHCDRYDHYFSQSVIQHRLGVFYDLYRAWRYPQIVRGPKPSREVAAMGDNHLVDLYETVSELRPRIRFSRLTLPPTFEQLHSALPEGPTFVELARKENHVFDRMERSRKAKKPKLSP